MKLDPNDDQAKIALTRVYSVLGNNEKALQFSKALQDKTNERFTKGVISSLIYLRYLKYDPLLDNIRKETRFQTMVSEYENIYNITHERFKGWLEKKGMLKE